MATKTNHLLQIHLATLLFGIAGLFGKWLDLHPILIVLGRVFFASISLSLLMLIQKQSLGLKRQKDALALLLLGAILAFHWVAFFQAIQLSTVAIGLLTFSTFPVFTVLLEPLFFKENWHWRDFLIAAITFGGVLLVIPEFELNSAYTQGAIWGVLSGLSFALLAIINRSFVRSYSSIKMAFYQDMVALFLLLPVTFYLPFAPNQEEVLMLMLLGIIFTALSHVLFINGLKTVKAKVASVIGSLEPVYGIVAAMFFFHEIPAWREIAGGMVILGMAFYVSTRK